MHGLGKNLVRTNQLGSPPHLWPPACTGSPESHRSSPPFWCPRPSQWAGV